MTQVPHPSRDGKNRPTDYEIGERVQILDLGRRGVVSGYAGKWQVYVADGSSVFVRLPEQLESLDADD